MDTFIQKIIKQEQIMFPDGKSRNITHNQSFYPDIKATYFDERNKVCNRGDCITIEGYNLNAVIWAPNCISLYHTQKHLDFISFDFNGCVMASFDMDTEHYAAHIQKGGSDCTRHWINFFEENKTVIKILVMFRPDSRRIDEISVQPSDGVWLWGLITPNRECYSIYVSGKFRDGSSLVNNNLFSLKLIVRHQTPFHLGGYDSILRPDGDPVKAWDNFFETMPTRDIYPVRSIDISAPRRSNTSFSCC